MPLNLRNTLVAGCACGLLLLTACGGANGTSPATASATAPVTPPETGSVTITGPGSVSVGNPGQYTATVTGTQNQAVTWAINGVTGGNATFGTIQSNGLFTPPAVVPASNAIVITAVSVAMPAVTGTLNATS